MSKYLLLFILSIYFSVISYAQDSLNIKANQTFTEYLNKLPPKIQVQFFVNGKKAKKSFMTSIYSNGVEVFRSNSKEFILDSEILTKSDSLFFLVKYKKISICSKKYHFSSFLHGGRFTVGIVSDFKNEREKYIKDTITYEINNRENQLAHLIKKDVRPQDCSKIDKCQLSYFVIKNNINPWVDYEYKFRAVK
jgi:hypothetical protein